MSWSGLDLPLDEVPMAITQFRWAVMAAGATAIGAVLVRFSSFDLSLMAVREQSDAAMGLGVNVFRQRLAALVLSGAFTGLAGEILAFQQVHLEPNGTLGLSWTINVVLMTVIGGIGTLTGPTVGTILVYCGLIQPLSSQPILGPILEGVAMIAIIRLSPRGVWPTAIKLVHALTSRPHPSTQKIS